MDLSNEDFKNRKLELKNNLEDMISNKNSDVDEDMLALMLELLKGTKIDSKNS